MCAAKSLQSHLFVTLWTVACQAPLSMGFVFLSSPALAGRFFTTSPPGEPMYTHIPPHFKPPSLSLPYPIPLVITEDRAELPGLHSKSLLAGCLTHGDVYDSMLPSQFILSSPPMSASPFSMSAFLLLSCKLFFVLWYVVNIIDYPLNTNNSNSSLWVEAISGV